jgi:uncharacterized Zn-binding protein involved in type VI secretion
MDLHRTLLSAGTIAAISLAAWATASAQDPAPGVVVQGSPDVTSGGLPAARKNDATTTPQGAGVEEGSNNVIINGKPAARLGDRTNCGVIVRGSNNVFINGKPMARTGDVTSGC